MINVGSENTKQVRLVHDTDSSAESPGLPRIWRAHISTHALLLPPLLSTASGVEERWKKRTKLGKSNCLGKHSLHFIYGHPAAHCSLGTALPGES